MSDNQRHFLYFSVKDREDQDGHYHSKCYVYEASIDPYLNKVRLDAFRAFEYWSGGLSEVTTVKYKIATEIQTSKFDLQAMCANDFYWKLFRPKEYQLDVIAGKAVI